MSDFVNKYADFISKQQKELKGSTVNTIGQLSEAAKKPSFENDSFKVTGRSGDREHIVTVLNKKTGKKDSYGFQGYTIPGKQDLKSSVQKQLDRSDIHKDAHGLVHDYMEHNFG